MPESTLKKGSKKAQALAARLAAVQAVYQAALNPQDTKPAIDEYKRRHMGQPVDEQDMVPPDETLFSRVISGLETRRSDVEALVDGALSASGPGRNPRDLSGEPLLKAILLCGATELLIRPEIDPPIVISDYIEVTHAFYDQGEHKLVNAILDKIKSSLQDGG